MDDLDKGLERVRSVIGEANYRKLADGVEALAYLWAEIAKKAASIQRLRRLIFGPSSKKTKELLERCGCADPQECKYVLESLKLVYRHDAETREVGMSPQERLCQHQEKSASVMEDLKQWLERQLEEKLVEPNSSLGDATRCMLKRCEKLTRFLHVPGAPSDNNVVERALKKAIIYRNNSRFYKTQNGARIGDLYMSLIHSAELEGVDPFDYLSELLRHGGELRQCSAEWMPWNYRQRLERIQSQGPPTG